MKTLTVVYCKVLFWLFNLALLDILFTLAKNTQTFTFRWHGEGLLDLGEVEDHGQLVYLAANG